MRLLLVLTLFGVIMMITAYPASSDEIVADYASAKEPNSLLDVADIGADHAIDGDRNARSWGGGGWGGRGWGGGGWGGGGGGWGGGGHGWGGGGWRGGGWGGGGYGGRGWGGGWG